MSRADHRGAFHRSARHGFTLVELMVVISIIALLIGILLPALAAARDVAKASACKSQLRQVGIACTIYAQEARGMFPQCSGATITAIWKSSRDYFNNHIGGDKRVMFCPNRWPGLDPANWDTPLAGSPSMYRIGYAYLANPLLPGFSSNDPFYIVTQPGNTRRDEYVTGVEDKHINTVPICVDFNGQKLSTGWVFRHPVSPAGSTNLLFGDGRVTDKRSDRVIDRWYSPDAVGW